MGLKNLPAIAATLLAHGRTRRPRPRWSRRARPPRSRSLRARSARSPTRWPSRLRPPAIVVIGDVVTALARPHRARCGRRACRSGYAIAAAAARSARGASAPVLISCWRACRPAAGRSGSGRGGCTPAGGCPGRARSAGRTARAAGRSGRRSASICSNSSSASARRPVRRYASISQARADVEAALLPGQAVVPAVAVDDRAAAQLGLDREHGGQEARVVVGEQAGQADPQRRGVHLRRGRRRRCTRRPPRASPWSSTSSAIRSRSVDPLRAGRRRRAAQRRAAPGRRSASTSPWSRRGAAAGGGPPRCRGRARASAATRPRPCRSSTRHSSSRLEPAAQVGDGARAGRRSGRRRRAGPGGWRRCRRGPGGSRRSRAGSR